MPNNKRILTICRATYRGVQILESEGRFILYLGIYRYEFETLPQATRFIDDWYRIKSN
ncbi:MAG: hypothetical protein HYZ23_03105 [Chloroflexi bacterium]|nr:hypothetical protein [Chloroflexota bacterium]